MTWFANAGEDRPTKLLTNTMAAEFTVPASWVREGLVPSLTRWPELATLLTLEDKTPTGQNFR